MRGERDYRRHVRDTILYLALPMTSSFADDKRGPRAKEHEWPLAARKSKEKNCPPEADSRNTALPTP